MKLPSLAKTVWLQMWLTGICLLIHSQLHADTEGNALWTLQLTNIENCRISSNKIEIFDGYQNATVQLHVTTDEIYLQSTAPIDPGYVDNGMQVEADDLDARQHLMAAEKQLQANMLYGDLDEAELHAQIEVAKKTIDEIQSHKWFKDYSRNPINASRLDTKLAEAQEALANLEDYQAALIIKEQALVALSRLPVFPLVTSDQLKQKKYLYFNHARNELISAFTKGVTIRIQLKFWPTWPATGTHETKISLRGYNEAFDAFQHCQKQG